MDFRLLDFFRDEDTIMENPHRFCEDLLVFYLLFAALAAW